MVIKGGNTGKPVSSIHAPYPFLPVFVLWGILVLTGCGKKAVVEPPSIRIGLSYPAGVVETQTRLREELLSITQIRSPITGLVENVHTRVGDFVLKGQKLATGYEWTVSNGPGKPFGSLTLCGAEIIINIYRPIEVFWQ
jgi:hypothetical protein